MCHNSSSHDVEIGRRANAALTQLTAIISDAVRNADDSRVTELDRVLRRIEEIVELASATPAYKIQAPRQAF